MELKDSFGAAFGRLMKRRRAEKRITQAGLATIIYPDDHSAGNDRKGDISKLETGKVANPQTSTVKKIAAALDISDAEIDQLQREAQTPAAQKLDHLNTLSRNALELLASRFEIERPHRLSDTDLQGVLSQKAEDYHRYRAEIEAIDERTKGLGNLKAAAEEAAERLDFEAVEDLLLMVEATETEIAAQTKVLRARNALLRGKAEHAFQILSAAAESFGSLSPLAPSEKRNAYFPILYNHGLRYGGPALPYAISLLQTALEPLTKESNPALWAETKNNLAATLGDQAMRTEGAGGAALLDEAVTAYNNALTVRTKAEHPVHWAETMENLAILEEARAQHPACETPRGHLEAALAHVEAALTVFDPVHMAYNHGTASRLRGVLLKALSD